jgi:hypothetical protein
MVSEGTPPAESQCLTDSGTLGRPVRFSKVSLCRKLHKRDLQYNVNPKKEKIINLSEAFCVNHTMSSSYFCGFFCIYQWIGFREILQETIDFPIKYGAFLQIFP